MTHLRSMTADLRTELRDVSTHTWTGHSRRQQAIVAGRVEQALAEGRKREARVLAQNILNQLETLLPAENQLCSRAFLLGLLTLNLRQGIPEDEGGPELLSAANKVAHADFLQEHGALPEAAPGPVWTPTQSTLEKSTPLYARFRRLVQADGMARGPSAYATCWALLRLRMQAKQAECLPTMASAIQAAWDYYKRGSG